jgi:hypothetical protein
MTGASAPLTFCIHDFEGAGQVQTMQQTGACIGDLTQTDLTQTE